MLRDLISVTPIFAVVLPVLMGLGLLYLYLSGVIGVATALVVAFALGAIVVTGVTMHAGTDEAAEPRDLTRL
jgi:hypothetical protein